MIEFGYENIVYNLSMKFGLGEVEFTRCMYMKSNSLKIHLVKLQCTLVFMVPIEPIQYLFCGIITISTY